MQPSQQLGYALGTRLLLTCIKLANGKSRDFVLLPLDRRTVQLWVSASDEQESEFVDAAKELANQILRDAGRKEAAIEKLVLCFD